MNQAYYIIKLTDGYGRYSDSEAAIGGLQNTIKEIADHINKFTSLSGDYEITGIDYYNPETDKYIAVAKSCLLRSQELLHSLLEPNEVIPNVSNYYQYKRMVEDRHV